MTDDNIISMRLHIRSAYTSVARYAGGRDNLMQALNCLMNADEYLTKEVIKIKKEQQEGR